MNKEDKICAFCKYHFIEEISFDSPQSCCKKRKATTEKWLKCDDFEYSDKYIEALQQKVNQLETNWSELKDWVITTIENNKYSYLSENLEDRCIYDVFKEVLDKIEILERGKE